MRNVSVRFRITLKEDNKYTTYVDVINNSAKIIKYANLVCNTYNRVNDPIQHINLKFTGPINPGKRANAGFSFDYEFASIRLDYALIEYFDGTSERISESDIKSKQGCYIATAVYGSYDCPQVWALRRFRDFFLLKKYYGRFFVKLYYILSPFFVKHFGNVAWFKILCKKVLDKFIEKLRDKGVKFSPYEDYL